MLHTTRKLVRQASACKDRYKVFLSATRSLYRDTDPIPLTVALETNGLDDTLWALRAVMLGEETERDRIARLFACDCAEHVEHLWVAQANVTWAPQDTIEVARRYALGHASDDELAAARAAASAAARAAAWAAASDAAWAAASAAAWDAARDAARDAEREWQAERLRMYLEVGSHDVPS